MSDLIKEISNIRKDLAEKIDSEEYGKARASMRQLSGALERLSNRLDATDDMDERNKLVSVHTAAQGQWLDANAKLREAGEEWL